MLPNFRKSFRVIKLTFCAVYDRKCCPDFSGGSFAGLGVTKFCVENRGNNAHFYPDFS